jgi:uncharacterized protein (DUF433 family)
MANLDWSQCQAVESVPGKRSGAWVFRDTRMPVATVDPAIRVRTHHPAMLASLRIHVASLAKVL